MTMSVVVVMAATSSTSSSTSSSSSSFPPPSSFPSTMTPSLSPTLPSLSSSRTTMVIRVRRPDGSIERIQLLPKDREDNDAHDDENVDSRSDKQREITLDDLLRAVHVPDGSSLLVGNGATARTVPLHGDGINRRLSDLGIQHGTLLTISTPPLSPKAGVRPDSNNDANKNSNAEQWDPFPDLAKEVDYKNALARARARRSLGGTMSYGDIAKLQSSLHIVEPQRDGPLKRVYMCQTSAERFLHNGVVAAAAAAAKPKKKKGSDGSDPTTSSSLRPPSRVGLLLGTVQRERTDIHRPTKARTSLSSTTSGSEYCTVAKVQAVWEPPGQSSSSTSTSTSTSTSSALYDVSLAEGLLRDHPRVLTIADYLDLLPIGWIFSYDGDGKNRRNDYASVIGGGGVVSTQLKSNDENDEDTAPPVWGLDVAVGARLQIDKMKRRRQLHQQQEPPDDVKGQGLADHAFVTLAMDTSTGETEAFQLSDVTIQMVHEGLFALGGGGSTNEASSSDPRLVPTRRPILVDGQETNILDPVLCLVNTAMLSHLGSYGGIVATPSPTKRNNGGLTSKTKRTLLEAIRKTDNGGGDNDDNNNTSLIAPMMEALCDFDILLALDQSLPPDDVRDLCKLVKKWARGQRRGIKMRPDLRRRLLGILET